MKNIRIFLLIIFSLILTQGNAYAGSPRELNQQANKTLKAFYHQVPNAHQVLASAKGVLIFPAIFKAGMGIGGEYGEGVLQIHNRPVEYYSTAAASIGFQFGAQKKSLILLFMDDNALNKFRNSDGWKIGIDASVAVITVGVGGSIDTAKLNKPIVAFVFDQKGLMYNLSLEGAKITRLHF